jgi:aminopeptidase
MDVRIAKTADILVNYSTKVKKGDRVIISSDIAAKPLVLEIYKACLRAGAASVRVNFDSYEFGEIFYCEASADQLGYFPVVSNFEIKNTDCFIAIHAPTNLRALSGIDSAKMAARMKVTKAISDYRVEKTRWVIANFPTEALAQEADMSLSAYSDFVFSAVNKVDWKKLGKRQEVIRRRIDRAKVVRILAPGTDLILNITGRKAVNCAGEFNMPDGEVFTSAIENSAEGIITYSYPAIFMGREFEEVKLLFKKGKVIKTEAKKGADALNKILDMDKGARRIGELGFGNNYQIKTFSKDILFDEKMGGTIHIALGRGYKETLSKNVSSLHWDMICDLRNKGEIWFDKTRVQKNGKWLF